MDRRAALVPLLTLLIASPVALVRGAEDAKTVTLERDLTAFPAGKYELVQEYEENRKELLEKPGGDRTTTFRQEQRIVYDATFVPPTKAAMGSLAVTVRRFVTRIVTEDGKTYAYDSAGKPEEQTPFLAKQLGTIVGKTARAEVRPDAVGRFRGLDEAWDRFAAENPGREKLVRQNRANFGDARITRILDRGRAHLKIAPVTEPTDGETEAPDRRTMRVGDTWTRERSISGPHGVQYPVKDSCRLAGVAEGNGTVEVAWDLNVGPKPKVSPDGVIDMRAGLDEGRERLTVHLASGVVVSWKRAVKVIRQRAILPQQITTTVRSTDSFTLRRVAD